MTLAAVVFAWLVRLSATEPLPWEDQIGEVAAGIAEAAEERPLPGSTTRQTAAVLAVMAWRESRLNPEAVGDHGHSNGLFQIQKGTLGRAVPSYPLGQAEAALELLETSWRICDRHPIAERLGWYAAGGTGCSRRLDLSRSRMHEVARLLQER
jgi:hypothetical protein